MFYTERNQFFRVGVVVVATLFAPLLFAPSLFAEKFAEEKAKEKIAEEKQSEEVNSRSARSSPKLSSPKLSIGAGDNFELSFRLLTQSVAKFYLEDQGKDDLPDSFFARRFRPYLEGKVGKNLSFRVMPDFAGSQVVVNDIYLDYRFSEALKFRLGKTKTPYSLNFWRSVSELFFIDFALADNLAPRRDFGALIDGGLFGKAIQYQLGVFNGTADGKGAGSDRDVSDNKEVAARLFFEPLRSLSVDVLKGLGVGISGTYGIAHGKAADLELVAFKTTAQENFFTYAAGVKVDGRRQRYSPQGYYFWGGLGLIGEYLVTEQDIVNVGNEKILQKNTAWDISFSYVLGGKNGFGGVKNNNDFDFDKGDWGALELALRYGELKVDGKTFQGFSDNSKSASKATTYAAVLKWHLSSAVKWAIDFEYTGFTHGAGTVGALENRAIERLLQTWVQVNF